MTFEIHFTNEPITSPPAALPSREIGACVEFQGIVRATEGETELAALHYEAYEPMARRELEKIFVSLHAAHPIHAILFIHRLGRVAVGEASLFIRILSAHRGEALAFCSAAIDRMKQDVPIWKARAEPAGSSFPAERRTGEAWGRGEGAGGPDFMGD